MKKVIVDPVSKAKAAALEVLMHNLHGPFHGLPRTAGWGYPEAYTRDMMISGLGFMASGNRQLLKALRRLLETLAKTQSSRGHIVSLVHNPEDRGASDCTPLFLMTLAIYRQVVSEPEFLAEAAHKAMTWMEYQSPSDRVLVSQMPTSDWRDEQWVIGFGLFVNTVVYAYLKLHRQHDRARQLKEMMGHFTIGSEERHRHVHEGLVLKAKPYYALWAYKSYSSERFDLLGNSIAILSGLASRSRAQAIVTWVETECEALREQRLLAADLPPNFFPYIQREDPDWRERYEIYNRPGEYHNGGIWPFICGFYIAAAVAAGKPRIAERKLEALTAMVQHSRNPHLTFGFNEWHRAQDATACGQDWQTWSAAMYLYAAACVEQGKALYFDHLLERPPEAAPQP